MKITMNPTELLTAYRRALAHEIAATAQVDAYASPGDAYATQAIIEATQTVRRSLEDAIMGQFNEVDRLAAINQAQAAEIDVLKSAGEAKP